MRPQQRRRRLLHLSFLLFVLLPIGVNAWFWLHEAADRFVAETGFAVRSMESGGAPDMIGSLTGLASAGSTNSDSYIVLDFLESRDLVMRIDARLDLRAIYAREGADPIFRLDPGVSMERLTEYWADRILPVYDPASGIITVQVEAFTPEDAKNVADAVLAEAAALVNRLSEEARNDAVRSAKAEAEAARQRMEDAVVALHEGSSANSRNRGTEKIAQQYLLEVNRKYAEEAYSSALASLDRATAEAAMRQRYLATFTEPAQPEEAIHPRRIVNCLVGTLIIFATWVIATLVAYAIRDHAA